MTYFPTPQELAALRALDTPTVCNALELVAPERRGHGYTVQPFFCPRPELGSMVGYARTATMRAAQPAELAPGQATGIRHGYYAHIAEGPGPTVTVIQDLDNPAGHGAWWGEVNTNIHRGLGSLGVITNGSIRDLDDAASGFQMLAGMAGPSHAWVHIEEFAVPVTVHGMAVDPGDLIHADQHGAVVVPATAVAAIPKAAAEIAALEHMLIDASQRPDFSIGVLQRLMGGGPGH